MAKINWHVFKLTELFAQVGGTKNGLTSAEAQKRLAQLGANILPEDKRPSRFSIFWRQIKSPLVYVLLIAALVTAVLREFTDMGVILAAVVVNALIGFWQEWQADNAFVALKAMVKHAARVLRDGEEVSIDASGVVQGDLIFLQAGDRVPADSRLLETFEFEVNEAALTGESMPVIKHTKVLPAASVLAERANMVFQGTTVARGKAKAVVVATGKETAFGEIALLVHQVVEPVTPLQHELHRLAKVLGIVTVLIAVGIFGMGIWQGRSLVEMFLTAVAVAVAAIPEGLLISLTVILAIGMRNLAQRKAIVKRLIAAETLGSVSVICTDKTGTITTGEMELTEILAKDKEKAFIAAIVGNDSTDPTSLAIQRAGPSHGIVIAKLNRAFPKIDEVPFESAHKWSATLHRGDEHNVLYVRGAPEKIIEFSSATPAQKRALYKQVEDMADRGVRVLAVAEREFPKTATTIHEFKNNSTPPSKLSVLGLLGLKDPLRPHIQDTIARTAQAGIRTVLITGDHARTAGSIAAEAGIVGEVISGEEIDKLDDEALAVRLKGTNIFARVLPKHKVRIVDAFHAQGLAVAMTGDGVNDAPALKAADIGIAVGSGTDVAKEAADVVLLDNNFETIVGAVEGGRTIYENVKKVVAFLLSTSWKEIIIVAGSLLFGLPLPVVAAQILWINLIEDSFPSMALAFDPSEPGLMQEAPRKKGTPLLDAELNFLIFGVGITASILLFALYFYLFTLGSDLMYTRTMIFAGLGVNTLFTIGSIRSIHQFMWKMNPLRNPLLAGSIVLSALMLILAIYLPPLQQILRTVPLGPLDWLPLIGLGIINVVLIEVVKGIFIIKRRNNYAKQKVIRAS